jgi:hypothetical protein
MLAMALFWLLFSSVRLVQLALGRQREADEPAPLASDKQLRHGDTGVG